MSGDKAVSCACMLIALVYGSQTAGLQQNGFIFPRMIAALLFVLSGILFTLSFFGGKAETGPQTGERKDGIRIAGALALMIAWVSLLHVLGFIVSSVCFLTALTLIIDRKAITFNRTVYALAVYTAVAVLLWVVFFKVLRVLLPGGYFL